MILSLILLNINLNCLQCILRYFCFKNYIDRLKTLMNLKFRSVYHYYFLRGLSPREVHEEMIQAYGEDCPHEQTIRKWYKRFEDGLELLKDANRSGKPKNPSLVPKIRDLLSDYPFLSARSITNMLNTPKTTILRVLHEEMNYMKLNFRWIPHELDDYKKADRIKAAQEMLEILGNKKNAWCNIITGNET